MGFYTESDRMDDGRSLRSCEAAGQASVDHLASIKTALLALKAKAEAGVAAIPPTHTAEDVAEVDAVIASLAVQIQALLV